MRDRWLASWSMVRIYILWKNNRCLTIVGWVPSHPPMTGMLVISGPSKTVSIWAGSVFAASNFFFLGGYFYCNLNSKSNSNSNLKSNSKSNSNSNSNSNPNSMIRDSLVFDILLESDWLITHAPPVQLFSICTGFAGPAFLFALAIRPTWRKLANSKQWLHVSSLKEEEVSVNNRYRIWIPTPRRVPYTFSVTRELVFLLCVKRE